MVQMSKICLLCEDVHVFVFVCVSVHSVCVCVCARLSSPLHMSVSEGLQRP